MLRNPIYSDFSGPAGDTRVRGLNCSEFLTSGWNFSVKQQESGSWSLSELLLFIIITVLSCHLLLWPPLVLRRKGTHSSSSRQLCPHRYMGSTPTQAGRWAASSPLSLERWEHKYHEDILDSRQPSGLREVKYVGKNIRIVRRRKELMTGKTTGSKDGMSGTDVGWGSMTKYPRWPHFHRARKEQQIVWESWNGNYLG